MEPLKPPKIHFQKIAILAIFSRRIIFYLLPCIGYKAKHTIY